MTKGAGAKMTRHSWFRNSNWSSDIEASFFAKLGRARDKGQYLRIQAHTLASSYPLVALRLLDQSLTLGDRFDLAQAYVDRATALLALDDTEGAIEAYEAALFAEERRPNVMTLASLNLPLLIARRKDRKRYRRGLALLEKGSSRLTFPADHFCWHAAMALIVSELGKSAEAQQHAQIVLKAADREHSGFRYHPRSGLVADEHKELRRELARIVSE
jgi:tetratricopeptide (TPR) repeat protein